MGRLGAEELRRVQSGLVDHNGHTLGLHALHDALDKARADIFRVVLHCRAENTYDNFSLRA